MAGYVNTQLPAALTVHCSLGGHTFRAQSWPGLLVTPQVTARASKRFEEPDTSKLCSVELSLGRVRLAGAIVSVWLDVGALRESGTAQKRVMVTKMLLREYMMLILSDARSLQRCLVKNMDCVDWKVFECLYAKPVGA